MDFDEPDSQLEEMIQTQLSSVEAGELTLV